MTVNADVELRGLDRMQRDLESMARRSVPFAARDVLNGLAFAGRRIWQDEMAASLTLRNRYTQRQALVDRARGLNLATMEARLGHPEDYVRRLEEGEGERASGSAVPIPTEHAAGQAKGSLPGGRKRAVRRPNVIRALGKLKRQGSGVGRKARNARAVRHALKTSNKLALLDLDRRKGIYRVTGGKRRPKLRKLYDLSRRFVPLPRIPTLQRSLRKALARAPELAHAALLKQLQRNRVGGY